MSISPTHTPRLEINDTAEVASTSREVSVSSESSQNSGQSFLGKQRMENSTDRQSTSSVLSVLPKSQNQSQSSISLSVCV